MRIALTALAALALPTLAAAQSSAPDQRLFLGLGPIGLPLPSITSTLPPIGLPLAPIGLPPKINTTFRSRGQRPDRSEQRSRSDSRRDSRSHTTFVYFVAPYYVGVLPPAQAPEPTVLSTPPPAPIAVKATGVLRLELDGAARGAQVFVDRYFAGTLEDLSGELLLETGPHQINVRAEGYEPLVFDVKVDADRRITYRGALDKIDAVAKRPETPAAPTTIYFIPGCYLGNLPPEQAALPATCDRSRLSTYKP